MFKLYFLTLFFFFNLKYTSVFKSGNSIYIRECAFTRGASVRREKRQAERNYRILFGALIRPAPVTQSSLIMHRND